jgi:hypothetical protein
MYVRLHCKKVIDKHVDCVRKFASINFGYDAFMYGNLDRANSWASNIADKILKPAGIAPGLHFTWNESTKEDMIKRNHHLSDKDILLPRKSDGPYLIAGLSMIEPKKTLLDNTGEIVRSPRNSTSLKNCYIEATPLYIGQIQMNKLTNGNKKMVVGGLVEPIGCSTSGGKAPVKGLSRSLSQQTIFLQKPTKYLDLATIATTALFAPGELLEGDRLAEPLMDWICDYWSPLEDKPTVTPTYIADGSNVMNIPIFSYIQRGVEKIVSVVNSHTSIDFGDLHDFGAASNWKYCGKIRPSTIDPWLASLFGYTLFDIKVNDKYKDFSKNHIFESNMFEDLIQGFYDCFESDLPMIIRRKWITIENHHYGIPAGKEVDVTFYYLAPCKLWKSRLSSEIEQYIEARKEMVIEPRVNDVIGRKNSSMRKDSLASLSGRKDSMTSPYSVPWSNKFPREFEHFPNLSIHASSYTKEEINLLANYVGWVVLENKAIFTDILS